MTRSRPSLAHEILVRAIPILRRSGEVHDAEEVRRDVLAAQGRRGPARPPRRGLSGCTARALAGSPFPVFELLPPGQPPTRTVLHLHGGGFVGGLEPIHWRFAARLARRTGSRVVLPAYPLTPVHSWRDTLPGVLELFERLAVESPRGVTVLGDSAGGGLALVVAQQVARLPGPQPTGLVLLSPWVDLAGDTPGTEGARAADPWLTLSKLRLYGGWWAGGDDPHRPEVSALHGDCTGLPPTLVHCGTRDLLLPQVRAAVERMRAAGVEVDYREEAGLLHVFSLLPVPEGRAALAEVADFVTSARH